MFISLNPATGRELARFPLHDEVSVDMALEAAAAAQRHWRRIPVAGRVPLLSRLAQVLRAGQSDYAALITAEMGKPLAEAMAEIEKCAWACDHYADYAPRYLADQPVASAAGYSAITHDPLGVVLAVMPWNYPFWQFFRFAAPTLAAGNAILLKHAANVPQCALAIADALRRAECPDGLVQVLFMPAEKVAGLIADDRVAAVTLTGSAQVGSLVAAQAGGALKKQVLELGGSDPFIVLADADVERAASVAVTARFTNAGQSCVNAKRFIVADGVADRFVAAFVRGARALVVGDPMAPGTAIGPLARANLRDGLHDQVERTLAAGAVLCLGGAPLPGPGFFYPPTVLDHVTLTMAAFREETFGPVAAITRVAGVEEALALANATDYGLGAALWTRDGPVARDLARRINAGAVFINGMVASDPRLPFGGIKRSGYGRELGEAGIREFTNIKTLWVGPPTAAGKEKTA